MAKKPKVAIVLFNLGGPDSPKAIKPFLFNLFNDPAIIRLPNPFRYLLARLISHRREKTAKEVYAGLGGRSPLLRLTNKQADSLRKELKNQWNCQVFVSMRYWHPMSDEVVKAIKEFVPDQLILLPLYPQFSTTTTASSLKDWHRAAAKAGLDVPTHAVCCYPEEPNFIEAHAKLILPLYMQAETKGKPRILFSAHGLPEKVIKSGDPYQWQVERTTIAILEAMGLSFVDYANCYQSRVGLLKWIGPSTDEEIIRAGKDRVPIVVVPVAFVSEHVETLIELDVEYAKLAKTSGVPYYVRVPALGEHPAFIRSLASLCRKAMEGEGLNSAEGKPLCPPSYGECACRNS